MELTFPTLNQISFKPWFVIKDGKDAGKVKVPTLNFINFLGELGFYYASVNGLSLIHI